MMLKTYFRQALALFRQNRLFSTLYIAGTGLAIAMTVIVAVVYYVKLAPVYPEVNRRNTYYLSGTSFERNKDGHFQSWSYAYSYRALQEWFYPLKNAREVSASTFGAVKYIQPSDRSGDFAVQIVETDPAYFRIYAFRFFEGQPFTQADLESGIRKAVITDKLARRLFGEDKGVIGRQFLLDYEAYQVCGVVRGASYLTNRSYADLYVPYSTVEGYRDASYLEVPYCGPFQVTVWVENGKQGEALCDEVHEIVRKQNLLHEADGLKMSIEGDPVSHLRASLMMSVGGGGGDWWRAVRYLLFILLALLLVPALNLSGLIASRMESRLPEMGIRKAFGGGRSKLLSQVLWENFLLTLAGGVLGLLVAWIALYGCREWVFRVFDRYAWLVPDGTDVHVSGEMLFAPAVFLITLVFCLVLNTLSALLPAWLSLRNPIVHSLYEKR